MVFLSVECLQKVERSLFSEGIKTRAIFARCRANMATPANLGHARDFFSLNFEAIENPSVDILKTSIYARSKKLDIIWQLNAKS